MPSVVNPAWVAEIAPKLAQLVLDRLAEGLIDEEQDALVSGMAELIERSLSQAAGLPG